MLNPQLSLHLELLEEAKHDEDEKGGCSSKGGEPVKAPAHSPYHEAHVFLVGAALGSAAVLYPVGRMQEQLVKCMVGASVTLVVWLVCQTVEWLHSKWSRRQEKRKRLRREACVQNCSSLLARVQAPPLGEIGARPGVQKPLSSKQSSSSLHLVEFVEANVSLIQTVDTIVDLLKQGSSLFHGLGYLSPCVGRIEQSRVAKSTLVYSSSCHRPQLPLATLRRNVQSILLRRIDYLSSTLLEMDETVRYDTVASLITLGSMRNDYCRLLSLAAEELLSNEEHLTSTAVKELEHVIGAIRSDISFLKASLPPLMNDCPGNVESASELGRLSLTLQRDVSSLLVAVSCMETATSSESTGGEDGSGLWRKRIQSILEDAVFYFREIDRVLSESSDMEGSEPACAESEEKIKSLLASSQLEYVDDRAGNKAQEHEPQPRDESHLTLVYVGKGAHRRRVAKAKDQTSSSLTHLPAFDANNERLVLRELQSHLETIPLAEEFEVTVHEPESQEDEPFPGATAQGTEEVAKPATKSIEANVFLGELQNAMAAFSTNLP